MKIPAERFPSPAASFAGNGALALVSLLLIVVLSAALVGLYDLLSAACTPSCP